MTESKDRSAYSTNKWNVKDLYKSEDDFYIELENLTKYLLLVVM